MNDNEGMDKMHFPAKASKHKLSLSNCQCFFVTLFLFSSRVGEGTRTREDYSPHLGNWHFQARLILL